MSSIVVVGAQWGDEGKGKIVDVFAAQADIIVRFQGGDNAGHTVVHDGEKKVFHLLPSGILHKHTTCVIGGGVVINLEKLSQELKDISLDTDELTNRLVISPEAHLILPCHIASDRYAESCLGNSKIGTTLRGIDPAYADRCLRTGVRMGALLAIDSFRERVDVCLDARRIMLPEEIAKDACDVQRVVERQIALAAPFIDLIRDTGDLLNQAQGQNKKILFEGAQGAMLDISSGTYPYVTSCHTIAGAACVGAGVGPRFIDEITGVTKAYTTRVGSGPFPTELTDDAGERLRREGAEYGATTHRPRRCGWLDLVQLRTSVILNGFDNLAVIKLDVLDGFDEIGICESYSYNGKNYTQLPVNPKLLYHAVPNYTFLPGWKASTTGVRKFGDLPGPARDFILFIERILSVPVTRISVGQSRSELINRNSKLET